MTHMDRLENHAWQVSQHAYLGKGHGTKVGCALRTKDDIIYTGVNIKTNYRVGDMHAEMVAISKMICDGFYKFEQIMIVAEGVKLFTPCGMCTDWIFQFGGRNCKIGFSNKEDPVQIWIAQDLMPYYPTR